MAITVAQPPFDEALDPRSIARVAYRAMLKPDVTAA